MLRFFMFCFLCLNVFKIQATPVHLVPGILSNKNEDVIVRAVLRGDKAEYSAQMAKLLKEGTVEDFLNTVLFQTDTKNVYQKMSSAKKHKTFFTAEQDRLSRLLFSPEEFKSGETIGGVEIIIPSLENTALGQALLNNHKKGIWREVKKLSRASALEFIQISLARTADGQMSLLDFNLDREEILNLLKKKKKAYMYGAGGLFVSSFIMSISGLTGEEFLFFSGLGIFWLTLSAIVPATISFLFGVGINKCYEIFQNPTRPE